MPGAVFGAILLATVILLFEDEISRHTAAVVFTGLALVVIADCVRLAVLNRRAAARQIRAAAQAKLDAQRRGRELRNEQTQVLPKIVVVRDSTVWVPRTQVGTGPLAFDLIRDLAEDTTGDLRVRAR